MLPHFLADMRYKRRKDQNKFFCGFSKESGVYFFTLLVLVHFVDQFHYGADRRVEAESSAHVFAHLFDGGVQHIVKVFICLGLDFKSLRELRIFGFYLIYEAVYSVEELIASLYACVGPVQLPVRRGGEEYEQPCRIGAVFFDDVLRAYDIAERFGHLLAVLVDHALGEQVSERLFLFYKTHVIERHLEESRIHQVQDRMFHSADVLVYVHPVFSLCRVERCLIVLRVAVAQEIPG